MDNILNYVPCSTYYYMDQIWYVIKLLFFLCSIAEYYTYNTINYFFLYLQTNYSPNILILVY